MTNSFKFSPINIWIVLLLLLPNILFMLFPPADIPTDQIRPKGWAVVLIMERIGQIGVFVLPLFLSFKMDTPLQKYALAAMTVFILLYYVCWVRYFMGGRAFSLLYQKLLFVPIPMAVFPVLYCLAASIILNSWVYTSAAMLLAIGHISESFYIAHTIA